MPVMKLLLTLYLIIVVAASILVESESIVEEVSSETTHSRTSREVVCDAVGKCSHRLASTVSAAKEKAAEMSREAGEEAKEVLKDAVAKAASTVYEKAKEVGSDAGSKIKHKTIQGTKEAANDAMETIKTTKDTGKTIGNDVMKNVTREVSIIKEHAQNGDVSVWDEVLSSVQLIASSMAFGMGVWVTFLSSHIMIQALSRQQLGIVQSKIYPAYYRATGYAVSTALVTHMLGKRSRLFEDLGHFAQALNLMAAVAIGLTNLIYFEPRATRVMFERMKVEKEEGMGRDAYLVAEHTRTQEPIIVATADATTSSTVTGPGGRLTEEEVTQSQIPHLSGKLKRYNAYTTILNMLTMMSMAWHLAYLGRRLALAH
ncbi:unnamed protein product [Rhodiola kirilowii]